MRWSASTRNTFSNVLVGLSILLPFVISLKSTIQGGIPFWYDPARDFLLALENLQSPTLIGQPTGIPGVFYGPYWIWLISILQVFSKDPRWIVFFVQTLPYFTIFPYLFYRLTERYGKVVFVALWSVFILAYINYTNFLWNPHLAPVVFLALIYVLTSSSRSLSKIKVLCAGLLSGLIANFHTSFGVTTLLSSLVFLVVVALLTKKSNTKKLRDVVVLVVLFTVGFGITFLPSIAFEMRHDFIQSRAAVSTLITKTTPIEQEGISRQHILENFVDRFGFLFGIPVYVAASLFVTITLLMIQFYRQGKLKYSKSELRLWLFLVISSLSLLFVYLSSSNPVWAYHFIGIEVIAVLMIGLVVSKIPFAKVLLVAGAIYVVGTSAVKLVESFEDDFLMIDSLKAKQDVVEKIFEDAESSSFNYFAYSSAIYTFDYDYLFEWGEDKYSHAQVVDEQSSAEYTYVIIPETSQAIFEDFVNYKTSNDEYKTVEVWQWPNKTVVLKRARKLESE